jgi:hypothetical protein
MPCRHQGNGNENVSARRRQAKRDHDGGRTRLGVGHGIGTDVARTSADIILIARDLPKFVETLRVARLGLSWRPFGLNPVMAAFIRVAFELGFILNSTRLLSALAEAGE